MAVIDKQVNYMGLPMNIARGNPIPLDTTEVWYSWEELVTYATTSATAYVGQIVQLVDADAKTATAYIIANINSDESCLVEVGSATVGDNKTIELTADGVLRLVGSSDAQAGAQLVMGENGVVTWVKPDTTTVEGLSTAVDSLRETVYGKDASEGQEAVPGLTTRLTSAEADITALEAKFANMGGIFNFVGSMNQDDFANENADDYDAGDVILVDGAKEYVCVELENEDGSTVKRWEVLGDPSGVTALEGRVDTLEGWKTTADSDINTLKTDVNAAKTNISNLVNKDTELEGAIAEKEDKTVVAALAARVATNESAIGTINAKNTEQDTAISERATISYVDGKVTDLNTAIGKKADQTALDDVIKNMATDSELEAGLANKVDTSTYELKINTIDTAFSENATAIGEVKKTVDQNVLDIASLQEAVSKKADSSVVETISGKVSTLETTVASHDTTINTLNGSITALNADKADKTTVEALAGRVATNEQAIASHATEYTALAGRVTAAEGNITKAQETADKGVEDAAAAATAASEAMGKANEVLGNEGDEASANTVYGAKAAAADAQEAANKAQEAADTAQGEVDALEGVVAALDEAYKTADSELSGRIKNIEDVIDGVQGAMHFVGISSTDPSAGSVVISGKDDYEPVNGDVVIYNDDENNSLEYIYSDGSWVELGDVSAEAKRIADLESWKADTVTPALAKIPTIESNVDALTTAKATLEARVKAVEDKNTEQDTSISGLDGRLTTAESNITKNAADIRAELAAKAAELQGKIETETTARAEAVSELQGQIDTINSQLTWTKMGSV